MQDCWCRYFQIIFQPYYSFLVRFNDIFLLEYGNGQWQHDNALNQYSYAFGGSDTNNVNSASCRAGFTAVGHMCLVLPANDAAFQTDGQVTCADSGSTMYVPESIHQNTVMAVMLEQWVSSNS